MNVRPGQWRSTRSRPRCAGAAALLLPLLAGCESHRLQSALHPGGPNAGEIDTLWWYLFGVGAFVFVAVMLLLGWAVFRRQPENAEGPPLGGIRFVVLAGVVIPAVLLLSMLVASLRVTAGMKIPNNLLTIQVIGHQWWWEVRYPEQKIATANEIEIPAGQAVRIDLDSADVAHSFWVPSLNGKMDLIPGHPNSFWLSASHPGVYRGQCAEYCGTQHANMAFLVIAMPPDQYRDWVARHQQWPPHPANKTAIRGAQVFNLAGCKDCHTVAGTEAGGRVGPDLTHLASRQTLGAGVLQNTPGALEGWIADPQSAKPGNKMPRTYLEPDDLHALRDYLETLQ